jgi:hypothetical protein
MAVAANGHCQYSNRHKAQQQKPAGMTDQEFADWLAQQEAQQKLCACGCGLPLQNLFRTNGKPNRYIFAHYQRTNPPANKGKVSSLPLCACGCGQSIRRAGKRFVGNHYLPFRKQEPGKVDPARALALHNAGRSLRDIAAQFPGASRMAALRAIRRAKAGQ